MVNYHLVNGSLGLYQSPSTCSPSPSVPPSSAVYVNGFFHLSPRTNTVFYKPIFQGICYPQRNTHTWSPERVRYCCWPLSDENLLRHLPVCQSTSCAFTSSWGGHVLGGGVVDLSVLFRKVPSSMTWVSRVQKFIFSILVPPLPFSQQNRRKLTDMLLVAHDRSLCRWKEGERNQVNPTAVGRNFMSLFGATCRRGIRSAVAISQISLSPSEN